MGLTREQVQAANDISYEEVYVPEWLPKADADALASIESKLHDLHGDDPSLRDQLQQEKAALREKAMAYVWMLSAEEGTKLQRDTQSSLTKDSKQNEVNFYARIVQRSVRDRDGVPLFKVSDERWLATKSLKIMNRLANVALRINGLTKQDQDEILKN